MPNIYLALAEFGRQHERAALDLLLPTLSLVFPGAAVAGVVVDNALVGDGETRLDRDLHRVSGDNTLHEFTAWDRGMAWLDHKCMPAPDAVFVVANDTIARTDKRHRIGGLTADRTREALAGALVGWVEEYPRPVELFGLPLRQWVDTSLMFAERRTLDALRPLARPLPDDGLSADDWRHVFREPSPFSENYRAYLRTYFMGEGADGEFPHQWYAQAPVNEHNFDALKTKLRCVFCEHLLSARARALGIPIVDIRPDPLAIDRAPAAMPSRG